MRDVCYMGVYVKKNPPWKAVRVKTEPRKKELDAGGCSQRVNPTTFHKFFFFSFALWLSRLLAAGSPYYCRGKGTISFSMWWTFQTTSAFNIAACPAVSKPIGFQPFPVNTPTI